MVKKVINDDGGTATAADFTMHVGDAATFPGRSSGRTRTLAAGTYSVTETGGPAGYTATFSGECAADGTITLAAGDDKTCTVTNDDVAPKLTVIKHVVNDDGGTATAADFTMHVSDGANRGRFPGDERRAPRGRSTRGGYTVTETGGPRGYAGAFSGACAADGTVTLAPGDDKTCTVTNDDIAPTLTVIKHVVNDDGGTATAGDFTMHVSATARRARSRGGERRAPTRARRRAYTVSERAARRLRARSCSADCDGTVTARASDARPARSPTTTSRPSSPSIKHVVNDDGGTAARGRLHDARHAPAAPTSRARSRAPRAGTTLTLDAGSYTVGRDGGPAATPQRFVGDCAPTAPSRSRSGETKTCTITNDDIAPTLTVIKHVVNDNGGTAAAATSRCTSVRRHRRRRQEPVRRAERRGHDVDARPPAPTPSPSRRPRRLRGLDLGACTTTGAVTLAVGETKTCTITNDDIAPTLTVIKHVINDNGGTATASNFTMHIRSGSVDVAGKSPFAGAESPGTTRSLAAGTYSVSETGGPANYTSTIGGDCSSTGAVTLSPGQSKTCTIANDDVALPADVALDAAVSTASPALGNNFTYTLTATNLGPATARSVIVTDDIAAGVAESPCRRAARRPRSRAAVRA